MAQPGWFPDPGGRPGLYRFWDGTMWTSQVTNRPPEGPPSEANRRGWPILVGALVSVMALGLAAVFVAPRLLGTGPTPPVDRPPAATDGPPPPSAWDETSTPTPPPPTRTPRPPSTPGTPSASAPVPCVMEGTPVKGGRLYGGNLSVRTITDTTWRVNDVRIVEWSLCAVGLQKQIAPTWVSEVILAGIQPAETTDELADQAERIMELSLDEFYSTESNPRVNLISSGAGRLDGLRSWTTRFEVRVSGLGPSIPGDVVDIVVVDHGRGVRSALLTFATIGDTRVQAQVDAARDSVRVER